MTALNDILDNGWDVSITSKPTFLTTNETNFRGYQRVVSTQRTTSTDDIIGIVAREYFDTNANDAYNCIVTTMTSEADLNNMITAIKKVCATYTPTSAENILEWAGGNIEPFNGVRWVFRFTIIVSRAGIVAYT